jgi:hypothetical protein
MSWRARGKTKITNSAKNTGTGSVVDKQGGIGRSRTLRSLIARRAPGKCVKDNTGKIVFDCLTIRTYNTRTANAGSNARINNRI